MAMLIFIVVLKQKEESPEGNITHPCTAPI